MSAVRTGSDRTMIGEAVAERYRTHGDTWRTRNGDTSIMVSNDAGHDLEITFNRKGNISHLVHWVPVTNIAGHSYGSRQPISVHKRGHALRVIAGEI